MSDQTPDLAALEALAEAATPGPWTSYRPHPAYRSYMVERVAPEGHLAGDGAVVCCEDVKASENAEFIAAADPATVLWLIREVSDLRAEVAELERQLDADAKHAALGPGESCDVCTHRSFEEILADCESLSAGIEKAEATIERVRELADSWAGSRSDLGPVTRACGALLRAALDGGEPDA